MFLLALLSALLLVAPAAHAGSWQRPVEGAPLRSFSLGPNPYAGGQHRGVDLAAAPGAPVRSACAGRVSFAGRVPGGGLTVSVRCGRHVATYQQLGAIAVRRGRAVVPGMPVGAAGRSIDARTRRAHVHLGVRVAANGRYIDPLDLIGAARPAVPPLPPARLPRGAPPGRPPAAGPRAVPLGRAPAPAPGPRPRPAVPAGVPAIDGPPGLDRPVPAPALPWVVWAGLASVGLALPIGGVLRVRRRRGFEPRRVAVTAR